MFLAYHKEKDCLWRIWSVRESEIYTEFPTITPEGHYYIGKTEKRIEFLIYEYEQWKWDNASDYKPHYDGGI